MCWHFSNVGHTCLIPGGVLMCTERLKTARPRLFIICPEDPSQLDMSFYSLQRHCTSTHSTISQTARGAFGYKAPRAVCKNTVKSRHPAKENYFPTLSHLQTTSAGTRGLSMMKPAESHWGKAEM